MNNNHEKLITTLVDDLKPVDKPSGYILPLHFWLLLAVCVAGGLAWLRGPYRDGAWSQLMHSTQFSIETFVGSMAIIVIASMAFRSAIPAGLSVFKQRVIAVVALLAWMAFYVYGTAEPALAESTLGKRDHCHIETMLLAFLPLLIGLFWARGQWATNKMHTGMLLGVAAGSIAAMIMQFACMYDPIHALVFHVLPGLAVGLIGALIARFIIRLD